MQSFKGYIPPKKKIEAPTLTGSLESIMTTVQDLKDTKNQIVETFNEKIKEVDTTISEAKDTLNKTIKETIDYAKEIKQGDPGIDADEEKIIEEVLARIPKLDQEGLTKAILSQVPTLDENKLLNRFLKKIPTKKGDLKIIQEKIEVDPMSVIDKIMAMPEGTFKLKTTQVDGLEQTISAFRNQLSRGYLHGGGLSKVSVDGVTITGDGTPGNPLVGASSGHTIEDNGTPLPKENALNFIGATVTDNPGNNSTDITITGGSSLTATYVGFGSGTNTLTGSSNLTWNDSSKTLTVGIEHSSAYIYGASSVTPNTSACNLVFGGGSGLGSGNGGMFSLTGGTGGINGGGGSLYLYGGLAGGGDNNGGNITLMAGAGTGAGANGLIYINDPSSGKFSILDTSLWTGNYTYSFPDKGGTFAMTSDIPSIAGYLKTDGTTTGATSQAQVFTKGVDAFNGNTFAHSKLVSYGVGYGDPVIGGASGNDGDKIIFYNATNNKSAMGWGQQNTFWIQSTVSSGYDIFGIYGGGASLTKNFSIRQGGGMYLKSDTLASPTIGGLIENDGTHLYYTAADAGTRYQLDQQGSSYTLPIASASVLGGIKVGTGLSIDAGTGVLTATASGDMTLAGIQSVTGLKTFDKDKLAMKGTSTGTNVFSVANTSATSYTNILPAKDGTFAMTNDLIASNIIMPVVGTPTYTTLQDYWDVVQSSGKISGFTISAHAGPNGTVDVAAGKGIIKATDAVNAVTKFFDFAGVSSVVLTDDVLNYLYVDYNAGTPQILVTTDRSTVHEYDQFIIGRVFRQGNDVSEMANTGVNVYNEYRRINDRLLIKYGFNNASGSVTTETDTRKISVTSGIWYIGNTQIPTVAHDSNAGYTFSTYYYDFNTTSWVKTNSVSQMGNTQYNLTTSGNGLANLTGSQWANYWVYLDPLGDFYVLYGQAHFTSLSNAQAETAPTFLPNYLSQNTVLIARISFQRLATNFGAISNALVSPINFSAITNHDNLGNLGWTTSGHTGTASTIAGFAVTTSAAQEYTLSGTGTALPTTTAPVFVTSITTPSVLATANDSGALGASGTAFSDLFLASGAVINFDAGDITLTHSTNTLTLEGGDLALGANNLTMTGSLGLTGSRLTKGWFTDLEVTNAIAGSITGNAGTVTNGVYTTGAGIVYVSIAGVAGGQAVVGGTLTTQGMTFRPNAANLTTGAIEFLGTLEATNSTTGSVTVAGGLAVNRRVYATDMTVTNTITGSITGNAGGSSASCTGNSLTATTASALSGQYIDWNQSSGATSIANKPTISGSNTGDQNTFTSIPVSGQTTVTAASTAQALTLVAGTNITITTDNTAKSVTFTATGGGITWSAITNNTTLAINTGYLVNSASQLNLTLPTTAALGTTIRISSMNTGGFIVLQGASQKIYMGSMTTTTGVSGAVMNSNHGDSIEMVCTVANLEWNIVSSVGNIIII